MNSDLLITNCETMVKMTKEIRNCIDLGEIFSNFRIESSDEKELQLFGLRCFERMNELETRTIFKKEIWLHFSGRKMFLYVLLFATPGHPTRKNKVNTLTMLADRYGSALIQNHC